MTVKIQVVTLRSAVTALAVAVAVVVALAFSVSSAKAFGEARPLRITSFSFQATEAVATPPLSRESWGYEYRPAPFTQAGGHPEAITTSSNSKPKKSITNFSKNIFPHRRATRRTWMSIFHRGCWVTRRLCRAAR